jgi:hypothetical protein
MVQQYASAMHSQCNEYAPSTFRLTASGSNNGALSDLYKVQFISNQYKEKLYYVHNF